MTLQAQSARSTTFCWGAYAACLLLAPWVWPEGAALGLLTQMGIAILACLSYHLLLGQGGLMSFGHAVYVGAGAYLAIHTLKWVAAAPVEGLQLALPLVLPLLGGLAGLLLALPLGWLSTRSAGTPFAMVTLGVGELVWALALMWPSVFGGEAGVSANRAPAPTPWVDWGSPLALYHLVAAYTLLGTLAVVAFTQTALGKLFNAARDNPLRLAFIGHDPRTVRWMGFAVSAFGAGVSGGLAALHFEIATPEVFGASRSGALLLFVFLGGSASPLGAVIGGVMMVGAMVWWSELSRAWMLYLGLLFVWAVLFAPRGLVGLLQDTWANQGRMARLAVPPPRAWPPLVLRAAGMALTAGGAVTLVEMLYHRQLSDTLGPEWRWLGLSLNVSHSADWLVVLVITLLGALTWWGAHRMGTAAGDRP